MPRATSDTPWLEAAVAWEVCASSHARFAQGRDPFFNTKQADYRKHADECRERHAKEAGLSDLALARGVGLKDAAAYLRATAADYRQMAGQIELPDRNHFGFSKAYGQKLDYEAKAQLLEGQAKHIEEL